MPDRDLAVRGSILGGILQSAMDAIITVDADQRILLFNAAAERMFRCPAAAAIGTCIDRFIPANVRRTHERHVAEFGETGASNRAMGRLGVLNALRDDGEEFPIEASISKVEVNGRKLFTVILRDITEKRRADEALAKAQAELAHITRAATLGVLAASIAHEMNQPLATMINDANALCRWLATGNLDEARHSASMLIDDGHRAAEILTHIRALARQAAPPKDWLDVNATVRKVMALAGREAQRHCVALETELSDDVPHVLADRIQVQQVIFNLITNAIEAIDDAGRPARKVCVSSRSVDAADVLIAVRDSGPGLDQASLDRLFDPFYTTKPHGLGMGLAISRSIIESHGGRLWATNAPHGAVFQFMLPLGAASRS